MTLSVVAVVVAAGAGTRLGGGPPKALRVVGGFSLLTHSLRALAAGGVERAVVVIPEGQQASFQLALADQPLPWSFAVGGAERQDSVRSGLAVLQAEFGVDQGIVLVHDAARPLVPAEVVRRVIAAVMAGAKAVIPVVPVVDTIRRLDGPHQSQLIDRSTLRAVQTPQGFDLVTLVSAHDQAANDGFAATDDAALCEYAGEQVTLVEGSRASFKVTEPLDLAVAAQLIHPPVF